MDNSFSFWIDPEGNRHPVPYQGHGSWMGERQKTSDEFEAMQQAFKEGWVSVGEAFHMLYVTYSPYHNVSQVAIGVAIQSLRDFEKAHSNASYRIGAHDFIRLSEAIRQMRRGTTSPELPATNYVGENLREFNMG